MKTKLLLLPILMTSSLISLSSCDNPIIDNEKYTLTYGTYVHSDALDISYDTLVSKMSSKESMIVVTYDQEESMCGCWRNFKYAIQGVMEQYHYMIYKIQYSKIANQDNTFNFAMASNRPGINFVKNGKLFDKVLYAELLEERDPLFTHERNLKKAIDQRCYAPNYYYLNPEDLDNKISSKNEKFMVSYFWHDCADCTFAFPNVLFPYTQNKTFKSKMYLVDLQVNGILLENNEFKFPFPETYTTYLKNHYISNELNQDYGYDRGFVPTFQYWENGTLKDAAVYFNDEISKTDDNKYIISRSYYSQERSSKLHYLDNVETKVLQGMQVNEEDVHFDQGHNSYAWNQEAAFKYHTPLLNAFLNKYSK